MSRNRTGAAALILTALLSLVSVALAPDLGSTSASRLAAIAAHRSTAAISAGTFVGAQLFFIVAVSGIARLAAAASPKLARSGGALGILGGFGHAVIGGTMLMTITMTGAGLDRAQMIRLDHRFANSPAMIFALLGLGGTVLGLALLAAALWRSRTAPRWAPCGLGGFILVEFALSAAIPAASIFAGLIFVATATRIAVVLARPETAQQARAGSGAA